MYNRSWIRVFLILLFLESIVEYVAMSMPKELTIARPCDLHCHFRRGEMPKTVVPITASYCRYGLAMPNTRPQAILTANDAIVYCKEIMQATPRGSCFTPIMTIELRASTTPETITAAHRAGVRVIKWYPPGTTTNSEEGLRNYESDEAQAVFGAMENLGMILSIHGEINLNGIQITERERAFLPILEWLVKHLPNLRIVLEHLSTKEAVQTVKQFGKNVAATITPHHLVLTLNDAVGQPHNLCNPIAKSSADREALIAAATSGDSRFFFGSDSAPHPREKKECKKASFGVFSAPVALPVLAEVFERAGLLNRLEGFTSVFGCQFYGLQQPREHLTLRKQPWTVPDEIGGIVPFLAGHELQWQIV